MKRNLSLKIVLLLCVILIAWAIIALCVPPVQPAWFTRLPHGSVKDNVYTSESAELTFTAPEYWEFPRLKENNLTDYVHEDILAYNFLSKVLVSVTYEDLAKAGKTDCGEEAYFDLMKEKLIDFSPDYRFSDYTETKIGRNIFKVMAVTHSQISDTYYYYIRRKDNCMLCINVQIPIDEDIDSVMANFS